MKKVLQGHWLGHPLHPVLVSFPIALWVTAFVADVTSRFTAPATPLRISWFALVLGTLMALLAAPTGLADWWDIKRGRRAWTLGVYHLLLNLLAVTLAIANLVWRASANLSAGVPNGPLLLSAATTLVVLIAMYLGGRMVYQHGTSVARMSKRSWRRAAEAGGARLAPEKE
jgi:uncharacterized membrane protein